MRIGFIDFFLDEWHANNYPAWIREASGGDMEVAIAFGLIDSPKGGRTTDKWCQDMGIARCASMEEVVDKSDALVVLSPDNAEMHEALCQVALRSGKPTYIDKTFAPDGDTARRIFALADAHGTPCYTSSALRYATEYAAVDRAAIDAIASWGPGDVASYAVHLLEPVVMLMQAPATRLQYVPGNDWYTLLLAFADGRQATITGALHDSPYMMNVSMGGKGSVIAAESDFFRPFIADMTAFFRSGKPPVDRAETLRIMDILGAAERARHTPCQWIDV